MSDLSKGKTIGSARRKSLVGFWVASMVLGTTGWWAGLGWTAVRLVQYALS